MSDQNKIKELEGKILDLTIRLRRMEEFIKAFPNVEEYLGTEEEIDPDSDLESVVRLVAQFETVSASFLQRKISIGYSRAARLLDRLEEIGIVNIGEGSKPRQVLTQNAKAYLEKLEKS